MESGRPDRMTGASERDVISTPDVPKSKDGVAMAAIRLAAKRCDDRRTERTTVTARDLQARLDYNISRRYAYECLRHAADIYDDRFHLRDDPGTMELLFDPKETTDRR
jgi:hypothetical protein